MESSENTGRPKQCERHGGMLADGLCPKCQYGPDVDGTCGNCRWHGMAPSGDGSAGTADHRCAAVLGSNGQWSFDNVGFNEAFRLIDELHHTVQPRAPDWCPCKAIPVTEEQVEFAERLPPIPCDAGHLRLMAENVMLRSQISRLELALDEIYCSVRRAKPC